MDSRRLILRVAERWRAQYPDAHADKLVIQRALEALDPATATAEEVEAIIGNKSWTTEMCDVCEEHVYQWLILGEPRDYESATVNICRTCLADATLVAIQSAEQA
jgi:hypothetical protein